MTDTQETTETTAPKKETRPAEAPTESPQEKHPAMQIVEDGLKDAGKKVVSVVTGCALWVLGGVVVMGLTSLGFLYLLANQATKTAKQIGQGIVDGARDGITNNNGGGNTLTPHQLKILHERLESKNPQEQQQAGDLLAKKYQAMERANQQRQAEVARQKAAAAAAAQAYEAERARLLAGNTKPSRQEIRAAQEAAKRVYHAVYAAHLNPPPTPTLLPSGMTTKPRQIDTSSIIHVTPTPASTTDQILRGGAER